MDKKEELTKQFMMVDMNEIGISTNEKHIIGTQALSPCIGFIMHNKEHKKAIVGHVSTNVLISNELLRDLRYSLLEIIYNNKLLNSPFDLTIIEGAYQSDKRVYSFELDILGNEQDSYSLLEVLESNIKQTECVNINSTKVINMPHPSINLVDEYGNTNYKEGATLSKQFAFDAKTGKFVTDNVYFGKDYIQINNSHIK